MGSLTNKHIRCKTCRFVRIDKSASEKGWTAYACGNRDSKYYGALLNVAPGGNKQDRITWSGCECGRARK